MKKDILNNYILKRLNSIELHLVAYNQQKNSEDIHRLRVDIKKIKAILSFAKKIYDREYNTDSLSALFHNAGTIRELQINQLLLCRLPEFPKRYLKQLKKEENNLKQQFRMRTPHYIKNISKLRYSLSLPTELSGKKSIKNYIKKELKKANKKLRSNDKEYTHRYRSIIKKLLYVYNIIPLKLQQRIKLEKTVINQQQKKVGKWHDHYIATNFLSKQSFAPEIRHYISKMRTKENRLFAALSK